MMTSPLLRSVALLTVAVAPAIALADEAPSFARHIVPLLSRMGCNGGTCHGAVQGQNGFRLSLFGADPLADYQQIRHAAAGRRVNQIDPLSSLVLMKTRGAIPHGGGPIASENSNEYGILSAWIEAGATLDSVDAARIESLRVTPTQQTVALGESSELQVAATFAGGVTEDVTHLCSFESKADAVADVDHNGHVTAVGAGGASILIRFGSEPVIAMIEVAKANAVDAAVFDSARPLNAVDERILAKLRRLKIPPADLADDATFLRRIFLDITGQLPSPEEVESFLSSTDPQKRRRMIDRLLDEPGYAALWTLKFCDILGAADFGVYADGLKKEQDAPRFQAWVRARLEENTPYHEFARRVLTATSRDGRSLEEWADEVVALQAGYTTPRSDLDVYKQRKTLDAYWQRKGAIGVSGTLQIAHAFLGLRLECAQCHRHPHDVWQQDDLLSFANFFMRVRKVGFNGQNEKNYPEEGKLFKQFNAESKRIEGEVKALKAGTGKQSADRAKKAQQQAGGIRNALNRATQQIESLQRQIDADARRLDDLPQDQKQARETLSQKIEQTRTKLADQQKIAAEKQKQLDPLELQIADDQTLQTEIRELERRGKFLSGEVAKRVLHAQIHIVEGDAAAKMFASVTSPLGTQSSEEFRLLGETEPVAVQPGDDPRDAVVKWLLESDNPFFTKSIVNRVWAHYFGRGIVDPPDDLSPFNPPSHPQLLEELGAGFVGSGYDLKWLHRQILNSRTYQQTSVTEQSADPAVYASFPLRRLPAEVMLDTLNQATGTSENMDMKYYHWPENMSTVEVPYVPRNSFVAFMLEQLGRPDRNSSVQCDCERQGDSSLLQVLSFANHPRVWQKVQDSNGLAAKIAADESSPEQKIRQLYLNTLSRPPEAAELNQCLSFYNAAASPAEATQSILWALINTKEFVLQH